LDPIEAQSRAIIASALIVRGVTSMPTCGGHLSHAEGLRLRELTDHIYRLLTTGQERMTVPKDCNDRHPLSSRFGASRPDAGAP
jgi:hypothetical protein